MKCKNCKHAIVVVNGRAFHSNKIDLGKGVLVDSVVEVCFVCGCVQPERGLV